MPNILKSSWPPSAKPVSTTKQVKAPLPAILLRRAGSALSVMARNPGIAAKGSTKKKIELSASTAKRTHGTLLNSLNAVSAGLVQITS